uniref:FERM domain-containing protein n=1 Tax=Panagrellus redivivus TaxID=6233 RepID=A0A7E4VJH6_PANRE
MKFAIFQIGKSAEVIEVPLNSIDVDAVYLLIRLAECFRDDPPYYETNGVKDFDCMPSDHPASMFTQQLSTNDFIAVSKAARCMRAQRLMDFLGSTSHKACTPQLINNVLKEGPFFTDVDHVRACG